MRDFKRPLICFVSLKHLRDAEKEVSSKSAVELHTYVHRSRATDHTGKVHDFTPMTKQDFVASRMYFPEHARPYKPFRCGRRQTKPQPVRVG
jgi:hypothetical protein